MGTRLGGDELTAIYASATRTLAELPDNGWTGVEWAAWLGKQPSDLLTADDATKIGAKVIDDLNSSLGLAFVQGLPGVGGALTDWVNRIGQSVVDGLQPYVGRPLADMPSLGDLEAVKGAVRSGDPLSTLADAIGDAVGNLGNLGTHLAVLVAILALMFLGLRRIL